MRSRSRYSKNQPDLFGDAARAGSSSNLSVSKKIEAKQSAGWHGMVASSAGVNFELIQDLGGHAEKVNVRLHSPVHRAGLRSGDYVLSISESAEGLMSLLEFERKRFPPDTEALVRYHRPSKSGVGKVHICVVRLKRPQLPKTRIRKAEPRVGFGPVLQRAERARFEAEMSAHPEIDGLGFKILIRIIRHYDGPQGAFPSYERLARDVGCLNRQTVMRHIAALSRLGIVEVQKGKGRRTRGGITNRFIIHWPEGWHSL